MERRKFIFLSALTAAAASTTFLNCTNSNPELDKKLALPQTLSQLLDGNAIKEIGKDYGKIMPGDYSVTSLERQLKNVNGQSFSSGSLAKEIYTAMNGKIQDDFDTDNVLILNGWVLSKTEAQQCALYSLLQS